MTTYETWEKTMMERIASINNADKGRRLK